VRPSRRRAMDDRVRASRCHAGTRDQRVPGGRPAAAPSLRLDDDDAGRLQHRHPHGGHLSAGARQDPDDDPPAWLPNRRAPGRVCRRLAQHPGRARAGRLREGGGVAVVASAPVSDRIRRSRTTRRDPGIARMTATRQGDERGSPLSPVPATERAEAQTWILPRPTHSGPTRDHGRRALRAGVVGGTTGRDRPVAQRKDRVEPPSGRGRALPCSSGRPP
jgi:hypothetical protein